MKDMGERLRAARCVFLSCNKNIPLVLWCILIFCLSSVPGDKYPTVEWPLADKAVHFGLYFIGGICAYLWAANKKFRMSAALGFCVLYGLSDEVHQLLVPRRSFSIADLSADIAGAFVGILLFTSFFLRLVRGFAGTTDGTSITETPERMKTT